MPQKVLQIKNIWRPRATWWLRYSCTIEREPRCDEWLPWVWDFHSALKLKFNLLRNQFQIVDYNIRTCINRQQRRTSSSGSCGTGRCWGVWGWPSRRPARWTSPTFPWTHRFTPELWEFAFKVREAIANQKCSFGQGWHQVHAPPPSPGKCGQPHVRGWEQQIVPAAAVSRWIGGHSASWWFWISAFLFACILSFFIFLFCISAIL